MRVQITSSDKKKISMAIVALEMFYDLCQVFLCSLYTLTILLLFRLSTHSRHSRCIHDLGRI